MLMGEIALGSFVTLELERQGNTYNLTSKVFDSSDTEILIAPPQLDEISFRISEKDKIVVYANIDEHLYRWDCDEWNHVTDRLASAVRLRCLKEGEKYNRRNAFRIPIDISVNAKREEDKKIFKVFIHDISFLGVGFSTYENLNKDDLIHFTIEDGSWHLPISVSIVRKEDPKERGYRYFFGATINANSRDISKYVTYKQLEIVRKRRNF